jgi:hypothetical protein
VDHQVKQLLRLGLEAQGFFIHFSGRGHSVNLSIEGFSQSCVYRDGAARIQGFGTNSSKAMGVLRFF